MDSKRKAAQLAYFLANLGLIDAPGGAEWFGREWTPDDLLDAYDSAGTEANLKGPKHWDALFPKDHSIL